MSSSRIESSQNVHERDFQKGWKLKLLTRHKCRQEMLVHAQSGKGNSTLSLHFVLVLALPQFVRHSSKYTGGLGFFHLFWTYATSINKDIGPRLSLIPLMPPALDWIHNTRGFYPDDSHTRFLLILLLHFCFSHLPGILQ